jgi:CBS domain-containing protein
MHMAETIRDLMTRSPRTVDSGSSAVEAARFMRDEDVGLIPIVESDRLVGTVTDRDIAVRLVAEGKSPEKTQVADIASRELVTIDPDQDVEEAFRLMAKHQVRRLPVVEEDGKLVGIVAQADIAKHVSAAQTGDVVEKISK